MKIIWDLNGYCNLKCKYCGATEYNKSKSRLTIDEVRKIINNFNGLIDEVDLFGGEPFLEPVFLDVLEELSDKDISITITTNGQQGVELLTTIADKNINLNNLFVSIDGEADINDIVRGEGTYKHAYIFLKRAIDLKRQGKIKANIGISTVLTIVNAKTIGLQLVKWINLGIDSIMVTPVVEIGRAKEHKELIPSAKQLLDIYESIGINIAGKAWEKNIYLDMEYPLIGEYLDAKYGTKFSIEKSSCSAVDHILYINSKGELKACREAPDIVADLKYEGICDKLQEFEDFLIYRRKHVKEKKCDCIYAEKCIICCYAANDKKSELCLEIEKKYAIENWQSKLEFQLTEKCCLIQDEKSNYYAIQYFHPNELVEYEKTGFDILKSVWRKRKNAIEISREIGIDATIIFRFMIQSYSKGYVYRMEV